MNSKSLNYGVLLFLLLCACIPPWKRNRPVKPVAGEAQTNEIVVGIFVYDGVFNTEFIASYDVFDHAGSLAEAWEVAPKMRVITIAPQLKTIQTAEGLRMLPDHAFIDSPAVDILIIPSGENYKQDIKNYDWNSWIYNMAESADYVISHCWGAFLLASAGQLEYKKATTYPPSVSELKQMFPHVDTIPEVRYVQDGKIITSAGGLASYEASLHLIKFLYGEKMALAVSGGLVFAPDNLNYSLEEHPVKPRRN